jgi:hypothetical protein
MEFTNLWTTQYLKLMAFCSAVQRKVSFAVLMCRVFTDSVESVVFPSFEKRFRSPRLWTDSGSVRTMFSKKNVTQNDSRTILYGLSFLFEVVEAVRNFRTESDCFSLRGPEELSTLNEFMKNWCRHVSHYLGVQTIFVNLSKTRCKLPLSRTTQKKSE